MDVDDLIDVAERVAKFRECGHDRHSLAGALRQRLPPLLRGAAGDAGVEPALVAAWTRSGLLRVAEDAQTRGSLEDEAGWLRSHGHVARILWLSVAGEEAVHMLVLFGSVARGDDHECSDVDLLVDGPIVEDVDGLSRLRGMLVERLGRSVELTPLTEARLAPAMLVRALHDGRLVKDKAGRWAALTADLQRVSAEAEAEYATYAAREAASLSALDGRR